MADYEYSTRGGELFTREREQCRSFFLLLLRRSTFLMTPDPDPVLFFIRKLGRLFFRVVAGIHEFGLEGEKQRPEKANTSRKPEISELCEQVLITR